MEAAVKALRDGHHGYTPANGILELREAVVADLNKRHGVEVDPDCVVVVPGGRVTMFFAIMMFGEAGAEIYAPIRASQSTNRSSTIAGQRPSPFSNI